MKYCFTLNTARACSNPTNKCCKQMPYKIEWWSTPSCAGSVRNAYVNGTQTPASWDPEGVWRVTNLNKFLTPSNAHGTEICLELVDGSSCPTMRDLCKPQMGGDCVYAILDASKTCCPTYNNLVTSPINKLP